MANEQLPPIRACIFDVDGLLINSEDIYTDIYNQVLRSYNRPDLRWEIKALQQSRGAKGTQRVLEWAKLPIPIAEWNGKTKALQSRFGDCTLLPGVTDLLTTLTRCGVEMALASSSSRSLFTIKTERVALLESVFPDARRVFGDDVGMGDARKKPMPDIFLAALGKINASFGGDGRERIAPGECLVFEDSIAGVEAGRRAGMRVVWVPHPGLAEVCRGREMEVLEGRMEVDGVVVDLFERVGAGEYGKTETKTADGYARMLRSLEDFPYEEFGIVDAGERAKEL